MLEIIIRCASIGISFSLFTLLITYSKKHEKKTENMVCYPKLYYIVGIICFVLFLIPTIITAFLDLPFYLPVGFSVFSILGVILVVASINCKIFYGSEKIVIQNFFGKKRTFSYDQISGFRTSSLGYVLFFGKRRCSVEYNCLGQIEFLNYCRAKYREVHGSPIPFK